MDQEIGEAAKYERQQQASSRESSPSTLRQTDKPGHTNTFPHISVDCFLMPLRHEGHEESLDHALNRHKTPHTHSHHYLPALAGWSGVV